MDTYNKMSFQELVKFSRFLDPQMPIVILGPPGGGKTACAREIARDYESELTITVDTIPRKSEDLLGPFGKQKLLDESGLVVTGEYSYNVPPEFLFRLSDRVMGDKKCCLIFDDLPHAEKDVQNACMRIFLERQIGDVTLGGNVRIIVTGNRASDARTGAKELSSTVINRTWVQQLEPDLNEWFTWGNGVGIDLRIIAYLKFKRDHFFQYPKNATDPLSRFATARSWHQFSTSLVRLKNVKDIMKLASGFVGEGIAANFSSFCRIFLVLPSPEEMINNPSTVKLPSTDLSVYTAASESIAHYVSTDKKFMAKKDGLKKAITALSILFADHLDIACSSAISMIERAGKASRVMAGKLISSLQMEKENSPAVMALWDIFKMHSEMS